MNVLSTVHEVIDQVAPLVERHQDKVVVKKKKGGVWLSKEAARDLIRQSWVDEEE